ncbi:MAG: hypothetical protein VW709_21405, partial [Rickettsiales bacterium]
SQRVGCMGEWAVKSWHPVCAADGVIFSRNDEPGHVLDKALWLESDFMHRTISSTVATTTAAVSALISCRRIPKK